MISWPTQMYEVCSHGRVEGFFVCTFWSFKFSLLSIKFWLFILVLFPSWAQVLPPAIFFNPFYWSSCVLTGFYNHGCSCEREERLVGGGVVREGGERGGSGNWIMKWRLYFHTALKCVLSILVTKVDSLFHPTPPSFSFSSRVLCAAVHQ